MRRRRSPMTSGRTCCWRVNAKVDEIIPFMSICSATTERQKEAAEIAKKADTMIVVGGKQAPIRENWLNYAANTVKISIILSIK